MVQSTPELKGSRYLSSRKEYKFSNGGVLFLHFIDSVEAFSRFQGDNLSNLYIDELGQLPTPEAFLKFRSSLRSTDPNVLPRTVCTANPLQRGSYFILDNYISKLIAWRPGYVDLVKKEVVYCNSTLYDNPFLQNKEQYVETLRASCNYDPAKMDAEIKGIWTNTSGSFYGAVLDSNRSKIPYSYFSVIKRADFFRPSWAYLSLDWGTRAPASLLLGIRPPHPIQWGDIEIGANSLILIDEFYSCQHTHDGLKIFETGDRTLTTAKMAQAARTLCNRNNIELNEIPLRQRVVDSAAMSNIGSVQSSIGAELRKFGAEFSPSKKGSRAVGWAMIGQMMEAAGDFSASGLYVTERVESFWATIPHLVHDSRNVEDIDTTSKIDHTADSLRYMVMAMQQSYKINNNRRWR